MKDRRNKTLLAAFTEPSLAQWCGEVERLLKGAAFEQKLRTPTSEGITLQPLYTAADTVTLPYLDSQPGYPPFLRAAHLTGYHGKPWLVAQELPLPTCRAFNAALLQGLAGGQSAVVLVLDAAGQAGLDPDQAAVGQVGRAGTSIASLVDLEQALAAVDLQRTPLLVQPGGAALPLAAQLMALLRLREEDPARLRGCIGMDPLCGMVETGTLPLSLDQAYDEVALLTRWCAEHAPGLRSVAAYGNPYHEGGGSAVQELAFTLATAVHHLRALESRSLAVDVVAPRLQFGFAIGGHFFLEIAKLRAARLLWARIVAASGGGEVAQRLTVHARTSRFTKTIYDRHVNILRGTTEAMAAVLGGVDSLHVAPFDEALGLPDASSSRLARNTQLILREESRLDQVIDAAGGAWYVESLTAELAEQAWELLQRVETAGGMLAALRDGWPQREIATTAVERETALATRRERMVGTNDYANPLEKVPLRREPDYQSLHAERSAALHDYRASETHATGEQSAALANLAAAEQFSHLVEMATAGATIGELSTTLDRRPAPEETITAIRPRRAAAGFEALRLAVTQHRAAHPESCRVFCANLGDRAGYVARLDFVRGFFQVAGFVVEDGEQFVGDTAAVDAAAAARASGAQLVLIVAKDHVQGTQGVELARLLKSDAAPPNLILAGRPPEHMEALQAAGVDDFVHQGCDALAILGNLARKCGVAI